MNPQPKHPISYFSSSSFNFIWSLIIILFLPNCTEQSVPAISRSKEDPFGKNVRPTDARTPAEEQAGFTVPEGFEIQLFASEPDIGKPLNMAFDAKGRLWLTQSFEYPFADTTGAAHDRISILEDSDGDGKADKFTVFADSLNIPIGIVAVPDGAIAYSIPHIYHFIDKNDDDKVDERKILYSGFEYEDTHGMINNLIRSWDGWIHAGHGFSNTSRVAGMDGDTIVMQSGNTFRFRIDGSRAEFTTTGRVNPFGYAYDEMGYTYSVDCHTLPIYQIIRGADYPHFGKQPTGIGFGPAPKQEFHGATALAGLEYYLATQFPEAYQQSFYLGDVVKSRVYRATIDMQGTTPEVNWEADFVVSEDPWFRPVDVKMGPDGAIYIADFYNRIIGHYEVPLDHPGRDRQRGRIWRIVYTGKDAQKIPVDDLSQRSLDELITDLDNPHLPLRMSVADQIVDRIGEEAIQAISELLENPETPAKSSVQALWILFRLEALENEMLAKAMQHDDPTVVVHALRIMFEDAQLDDMLRKMAFEALENPDVHIQRQASMVLAKNPRFEHLQALLPLRHKLASTRDTHFFYVVRQALRDHLRDRNVMKQLITQSWGEEDSRALADVMVGVDHVDAASFLLAHLSQYEEVEKQHLAYATHTARFIPGSQLNKLIGTARLISKKYPEQELGLFKAIDAGLDQEGKNMNEAGKQWGIALAHKYMHDYGQNDWQIVPDKYAPFGSNPWRWEEVGGVNSTDSVSVLASGPVDGEGRDLSIAHSPVFQLPNKLEFDLYGRKNVAEEDEEAKEPVNFVELRLKEGDRMIQQKAITELDSAIHVTWSLEAHAGEDAYLAIIDGSSELGEYIAVGVLPESLIPMPKQSPGQIAEARIFAAQVAKRYKVSSLTAPMVHLLTDGRTDIHARAAAADALVSLDRNKALAHAAQVFESEQELLILKQKIALSISEVSSPEAFKLLEQILPDLSLQAQKAIAQNMINSSSGIDRLLHAAKMVIVSPRLLFDPHIESLLEEEMNKQQKSEYEELIANMKAPSEEVDDLIRARLQGFVDAEPNLTNGRQIFTQNCAVCHQVGGQGGNIGPQLDGIGNWGRRALTEKILDPNRNISKAFVTYTLTLKDGKVTTGLFRREEGQNMIFANAAGQEFSIPKGDIVEQKAAPYTLMPDHFGQVISEKDYYDLLGYLLREI